MQTINTEVFDQLKAIMADSMEMLTNIFVEDSDKLLEEIKLGIDNNDTDKIGIAAHTLKSSAKNIGADKLSSYCLDIENCIEKQGSNRSLLEIHHNASCEMIKVKEILMI